jgi:hypothetical protein
MKKLLSLSVLFVLLFSCREPKYEHIGQEIIDGKVSAIKEGQYGGFPHFPKIWVQSPTETKEVDIPFEYAKRWKVGDTCLLIIEKYKVLEDGK